MLYCRYREGGDIDSFNIWETIMKNRKERDMTEAIRRLLEEKWDHFRKMKLAGRIVEIYLAQAEIDKILIYAGL